MELHNTLNPKLFTNDKKLKEEIRHHIIQTVNTFLEQTEIPVTDVVDVQLVGSNVSYNYTDKSDLDVHIILNFALIDDNEALVREYFNLLKSNFNSNHDIKLKGIPVEIYVDDVTNGVVSNGIYSVITNTWIKEPKPIKPVTFNIDELVNKWVGKIQQSLEKYDKEETTDLINTLYLIRKNAIAVDGEYSIGNQLFKEIRNLGYLDALKTHLKEIETQTLSLEQLFKI